MYARLLQNSDPCVATEGSNVGGADAVRFHARTVQSLAAENIASGVGKQTLRT